MIEIKRERKENMFRARRDEAAYGGGGVRRDQRRMFLTLDQPFLQESPTILNPFLNRTVSSLALSFTWSSKPAMAVFLLRERKEDSGRRRHPERAVPTSLITDANL